MTLAELHFDIEKVNHSKASRSEAVEIVVAHPEIIPELIQYAFGNEKNAHKVCWWLEFLNRQYIEVLCPYMDIILEQAQYITNQSAIRPIARIVETYCLNCYSKTPHESVQNMMTNSIKELMVNRSFEWFIDHQLKVAPRAYAMISLYHLGKDVTWVHSELKLIIEQNYASESAAYKARGRMVLKKLTS